MIRTHRVSRTVPRRIPRQIPGAARESLKTILIDIELGAW